MRLRVIVNPGGGGAGGEDVGERIERAFGRHGLDIEIRLTDRIADAFREAAEARGLDAVVAGGGDGTVSCAAGFLAGTDRPLGILPLGTLNHLAHDAGIPVDLDEAAAVIAARHSRLVDVAEVNGRIFVNNSSVGLYPRMVREREYRQSRFGRGKRAAMLAASFAALRHFHRHRLIVRSAGLEAPLSTPLLFVGNNRYTVNLFLLGARERIDEGRICVYAVLARSRLHFAGAALRAVFGRLEEQRDFVIFCAGEAEIGAEGGRLDVALDGETASLELPLRYRSRPGALRLIVPAPSEG